jgi:hypothetical protein
MSMHRDLRELTMERWLPHRRYPIATWRFGDLAILRLTIWRLVIRTGEKATAASVLIASFIVVAGSAYTVATRPGPISHQVTRHRPRFPAEPQGDWRLATSAYRLATIPYRHELSVEIGVFFQFVPHPLAGRAVIGTLVAPA